MREIEKRRQQNEDNRKKAKNTRVTFKHCSSAGQDYVLVETSPDIDGALNNRFIDYFWQWDSKLVQSVMRKVLYIKVNVQ